MPEVSVLMGIYNCADTLKEAVDCIINQSFTDWELIMCDDCSSDNTHEVAKEIAQTDSRIKVIKNEKNLTLAPTLNRCAQVATGKYMARMDGDDVCALDRLELEHAFLEENPDYQLVSCQMIIYDDNGEYGVIKYNEKPDAFSLLKGSQFCHAGCMMRMDVFKELGGYGESSDVIRIEDYDLWFRMYQAGYKGYNLRKPLYSMRDDRNALHRRKMKFRINEYKLLMRIYKTFDISRNKKILVYIPIIKGLMPNIVYKILHKSKANR